MRRDLGGRIVLSTDPRIVVRRKACALIAAMQKPQPPRVDDRLSEQTLFYGEPGFYPHGYGVQCAERYKGYICTREHDHSGPHAAHTNDFEQVASWGHE